MSLKSLVPLALFFSAVGAACTTVVDTVAAEPPSVVGVPSLAPLVEELSPAVVRVEVVAQAVPVSAENLSPLMRHLFDRDGDGIGCE